MRIIILLIKKLIILPYRNLSRIIFTFIVKHQALEVKGKVRVNRKTSITKQTVLGDNVNFNGLRIEGNGKVSIGNNFHSGTECLLITSFHNYNNASKIPYDEKYIQKSIIIEDNVWLGSRVLILGGVSIGEGAIIQAGSVVVKSIPKCGIAGGAPAKVFKYRDVGHYEKLKQIRKFH